MALARAEATKSTQAISMALQLLSEIAIKHEDYQAGFSYFKKYTTIQDSLLNRESRESLAYTDMKQKSNLNKQKIDNLERLANSQEATIYRKNELIFITLGLSTLIIMLLWVAYRYRLKASQNKEVLSRVKLANAQLNPHFLFNSLGAIQQLVLEKEDELMISNYIAKFSKLTRDMLNYTECESISLADELSFLNNYLSLQALRFNNSFQYQFDLSEALETEIIYVPPLITQPFVENSLQHAFEQESPENKLIVTVSEYGSGIKIVLEDNGVGINKTLNIKKTENRSMAIELTQGRLRFWSKKTGKRAAIDIADLSEITASAQGTRVTLNLP